MVLIALLLQAIAPAGDTLAPAFKGQAQCYAPDVARKACASIGEYARDSAGRIQNTAIVLISPSPAIVMRTVAPVEVKGGAVCGVITAGDLERATFVVNGRSADDATAANIRRALAPGYAPILGHEICTAYEADGETMRGLVSMDGQRRPELDQVVRWVSPAEGFAVKP